MENELREKEDANPMDAVKGKNPEKKSIGRKLKEKKKQNDASSGKSKPTKRQNLIIQVLNGEILTRDFVLNNLTFVFFILFLLLLLVAKGYYGKQLQNDINATQAAVDAETAEYIENKAKLEESTSRYQLVQALEKRGLKETVNPAKVIRIKKKENE
jgi:hypothetical protein